MDYKKYFELLLNNKLITPIWLEVTDLLKDEIKEEQYDDVLGLFIIYFSLIDDGNICMSLDKETLTDRITKKLDANRALLKSKDDFNSAEYDVIYNHTMDLINNSLSMIDQKVIPGLIGEKKIFYIEDNWLYAQKYFFSKNGIIESIKRLFKKSETSEKFDYLTTIKSGENFSLSEGQKNVVNDGLNKNLVITGGPGTGKTTSILFLLLGILSHSLDYTIYLTAPSGKAASRMKESIVKGLNIISDTFKNDNPKVIRKIESLEGSTIHRLLGINSNGEFTYNKKHQFGKKCIFIIDEASMIDICIFDALLSAIPDDARVFIMGDKNQLPSVESGAVFAELLKDKNIRENNLVTLDESKRFGVDTEIYKLASKINEGLDIPVKEEDWKDYEQFEINLNEEQDKKRCPIYYYKMNKKDASDKKVVEFIANIWGKTFYSKLQEHATNLDPNDNESLEKLFNETEKAKILCAENESVRGVKEINRYIKNTFINKKALNSINGHYPGQLMIINKNNKILELYNGDSGILVTFKDDPTIYFMIKSGESEIANVKKSDTIFKLGSYKFYPLRLIKNDEIDLAYTISIHKSQGSDYDNILVILPTNHGHPLLNRQIVYTAITRTKGNTFILSNQDILEEAKDTVLFRDTNIANR